MSPRGRRAARSLVRKQGTRREHLKILIVAEGEKTEPQCFGGLCAHLRVTAAQVLAVRAVGIGGDPVRVVKEAGRRREEERRRGDPFDQV